MSIATLSDAEFLTGQEEGIPMPKTTLLGDVAELIRTTYPDAGLAHWANKNEKFRLEDSELLQWLFGKTRAEIAAWATGKDEVRTALISRCFYIGTKALLDSRVLAFDSESGRWKKGSDGDFEKFSALAMKNLERFLHMKRMMAKKFQAKAACAANGIPWNEEAWRATEQVGKKKQRRPKAPAMRTKGRKGKAPGSVKSQFKHKYTDDQFLAAVAGADSVARAVVQAAAIGMSKSTAHRFIAQLGLTFPIPAAAEEVFD